MLLRLWRSHGMLVLVGLLLSVSIQAQSLRILPNLEKEKITEKELAAYLTRMTGQQGMTFDVLRENDQQGGNYIQFQQYYYKIPIDAARVTAQVKNGILQKLVGKWIDEPLAIDINTYLPENQAIEKGKAHAGFGQFKWEDPTAESLLKALNQDKGATYYPQPKLVITKGDRQENAYRLAYVMDIADLKSTESYKVVLDARTGELISKTSNIYNCNSGGSATSTNLGNYGIRTDNTGSGFRLLWCQNTTNIHTFRFGGFDVGNPFSAPTEYIDADNIWNSANVQDQHLTDVHFSLARANDYFNTLGVNPFAGQELRSVVNVPMNNSYYAPPPAHFFAFGIGQSSNLPLICMDIVGHEYTHAVTHQLVGWNNSGEAAAINESLSDIFGNLIQGDYAGQDWQVGECVGNTMFQRSMSAPNDHAGADTYQGLFWAQGGPHHRGGVSNFWFFLLTNGGVGTNDNNDDYEVDGIGLTDAERLIWHTLVNYIGPNVTFAELRGLTLQAAIDLWGECSPQYISCMNAWHAVGVGNAYIGNAPIHLVADPVGVCLATLCFENTGYESYIISYWPANNTNDVTSTAPIVSTESEICVTVEVNPHVQYIWEVQARCGDIVEVSEPATFTTNDVCGTVTNIHVDDITYCGALVTWDFPIADHFLVEVAPTSSMNFGLIPSVTTTTNSAQLVGLSPNTEYVIRITVFCCENFSGAAVRTHRFTTPDLECPIPPFEVTASACRIFVSFIGLPNQTYSLEMPGGGSSSVFANGLIRDAQPNTTYTYRLRVRCGNGTCTSDVVSDWFTVTTPPLGECEAPTGLTATPGNGFPGVSFSWGGANGASSFRIRFRTNPNDAYTVNTVNSLSYYLGTLSDYYEFCVTSICNCDGDANVEQSEEVCLIYRVEGCQAPATYAHQILCPDQVWLSWSHVLNRHQYIVQFSTDGTTWTNVNPWPYLGANGAILNGLTPDTHYFWRVRTRCTNGEVSDWGPVQEFDTPPACQEVDHISATVTGDEVTITWNSSSINDAYITSFYEIRYRLVGSLSWNTPPIIIDETSFTRTLPCGTYEFQVRAHCGNCGPSEWSELDTFTIVCEGGCGNGLHIGTPANAGCDPCKPEGGCYVCILDANGDVLSQTESFFEIDWTVPSGYPSSGSQLANNQCISMNYLYDGQTFTATVSLYDVVEGQKTLRCSTVLTYTHDCGGDGDHEGGGGHDGGGGTIGAGGHLAQPSGGKTSDEDGQAFRVFPNPAANTLSIASASAYPAQAVFYDALGQRIHQTTLQSGETLRMNVSEWPAGVYFVKIADEAGKQIKHESVVISR